MGQGDRRKKKTDQRTTQDRGSRTAEQARSISEARRKGADAGRTKVELPPIPKESIAAQALPDAAAGALKVAGHLLEGKAPLAGGILSGIGIAGMVGAAAHEYGKAWKGMKDANTAACRMEGAKYGLNVIGRDARNPDSPHIRDGKPYTKGELPGRMRRNYTPEAGLSTEHIGVNARKEVDHGADDAGDRANKVLAELKTPQDRQAALGAFADAGHSAIEKARADRAAELKQRGRQQQQPNQPPQQ